MKILSIRVQFPEGTGIEPTRTNEKANSPPIWRVAKFAHLTGYIRQFVRIAAIGVGNHQCAPNRVEDVRSIRSPAGAVGIDISDAMGCSGRQGLHPEFKSRIWVAGARIGAHRSAICQ